MAYVQVIGVFDQRDALEHARRAILEEGLATPATIRVDPEEFVEELNPPRPNRSIWERIKDLFAGHDDSDETVGTYAESVRRGSSILVVTAPEEKAERIRSIMKEHGAIDLRRRVRRWMSQGWTAFDPAGIAFVEEEIEEERRRCIDEHAPPGEADEADAREPHNYLVYYEARGREIGRISERELKVLQDALEEEGPDDDDYWINPEVIDDLACRPGATRHLIELLRRAVSDNPDGIDIAYMRDGEPLRSLRGTRTETPSP